MRMVLGLSVVSSTCEQKLQHSTHASLSQAGNQPFIKKLGPSLLNELVMMLTIPLKSVSQAPNFMCLLPSTFDFPFALCSLLFKTSAGAHTVVATVPAINEAAIWIGIPSGSGISLFESNLLFEAV